MDINAITQMIGSVGFPIVCCVYLIYTLQSEMKELRQTIENNTIVITKLAAKLDLEEDEK